MFLNIRKIGKAKHKFKAKFILLKLTNEATPRGTCFKVQICRYLTQHAEDRIKSKLSRSQVERELPSLKK